MKCFKFSDYFGGSENNTQCIFRQGVYKMRLNYYPETDTLYINLSNRPSIETREVSEGVNLDYDSDGNLVGIDVDNASRKLELKELILNKLPVEVHTLSA